MTPPHVPMGPISNLSRPRFIDGAAVVVLVIAFRDPAQSPREAIWNQEPICKNVYYRGCGSVGRAVASNSRGPQFKSSHRQKIILNIAYCQLYWKDENKEKEAGNGTFKKECLWRAMGSGCGSVGRVVASDIRDFAFESRHRQTAILITYLTR